MRAIGWPTKDIEIQRACRQSWMICQPEAARAAAPRGHRAPLGGAPEDARGHHAAHRDDAAVARALVREDDGRGRVFSTKARSWEKSWRSAAGIGARSGEERPCFVVMQVSTERPAQAMHHGADAIWPLASSAIDDAADVFHGH